MKRAVFFLFLLTLPASALVAQKAQQYKVGAIGFYNLENLFDTEDDPAINDSEFLPTGKKNWNDANYQDKLGNMSRVISELGTELSPDGISILGVAEIENRKVLEDLVKQPKLAARNYQIIHFDSPDERGIDVGLLYQAKYFKPTGSQAVFTPIFNPDGSPRKTRDILFVSGLYDGEPIHILVNHWPSRSGGEAASQPYRNAAALICKNIADSLMQADPNAKILIMGDLNDDPTSPSVKKILDANFKKDDTKKGGLFNPMYDFFKRGLGTLAYQDSWNLFDQIIISYGLINEKAGGFQFYNARVFNESYLFQKSGQYRGYPHRTFSGDTYIGGFSDHLPVFVYLAKPIK
mgnify:CR=1 FL=1